MRIKNLDGVTSRDSFNIPVGLLQFDPGYNVRSFAPDTDLDDARLLESIRANGVTQPITVRAVGDALLVVAGHRRIAAARLLAATCANCAKVPAVVMGRNATSLDLIYDLCISNSGKAVIGMELADVFRRAVLAGESHDAIAKRTGYSVVHVRMTLALLDAPSEVQDMVRRGTVGSDLALAIVKECSADPAQAVELLQRASNYALLTGGKPRVTPKHVKAVRATVAPRRVAADAAAPVDPLRASLTAVQDRIDIIVGQVEADLTRDPETVKMTALDLRAAVCLIESALRRYC